MKKSSSFKKYVSYSLVLHLSVLGGLFLFGNYNIPKPPESAVNVELLTSPNPMAEAKLEKKSPRKKYEAPINQIVQQDQKSVNNDEPENSRFLSITNQKVTKQTLAAQRGEFKNLNKINKQSSKESVSAKNKSPEGPIKSDSKKYNLADIKNNLFKNYDPNEGIHRQRENQNNGQGHSASAEQSSLEQELADTSQTNDYVKDVDQGLETMLNTREFKYYSYYNRIRLQLSQHWEGKVKDKLSKMFKEGRSPASSGQDRVTKLMILLNEAGNLVNIQVLLDSGVRDLDDAAIEAFRAAAPFPNPPKGIVEGDGTVKIRWDFVLES